MKFKGPYKTFRGTTKKCENKNLSLFSLLVRDRSAFCKILGLEPTNY